MLKTLQSLSWPNLRSWFVKLGWIAACVALAVAWMWVAWPVDVHFGGLPLFMMAAASLVGQELPRSAVGRWIDGKPKPGVTAWSKSRAARLGGFIASLGVVALLPELVRLTAIRWPLGDWPRTLVAVLLLGMVPVVLLVAARRELRRTPELRIDGQGVWSRGMKAAVSWSDVEFAITPHALDHDFRLRLRGGGLVRVTLEAAGLSPAQALAVMRDVCPTLRVEPWTREGIVLQIPGATDVPDMAAVKTYD